MVIVAPVETVRLLQEAPEVLTIGNLFETPLTSGIITLSLDPGTTPPDQLVLISQKVLVVPVQVICAVNELIKTMKLIDTNKEIFFMVEIYKLIIKN